MLEVGDKAPKEIANKIKGKWTVIYFYPKDDTPGCTKEACSIRDYNSEIAALGARVIGVSKDGEASHQKFIKKYKLPFELWSDEEHKLMDEFGVWQEKSLYGHKYMGTVRATFLIDPKGKIVHIWPKVAPTDHGQEIIEKLKELM